MCYNDFQFSGGAVAQLGEHHVRNVGVVGSNPICSTILKDQGPGRLSSFLMYSMRKLALILLVTLIGINFSCPFALSESDKIRVKIEVVAEKDVDRQVSDYINTAFEALPDVEIVDEDPGVYIHVIVRRLVTNRGRRLGYVIASASSEIIEMNVDGKPFTYSDYNGLWLETGPDLRGLCYQCVDAMNIGVFEGIRGVMSTQAE